MKYLTGIIFLLLAAETAAQKTTVSEVWVADKGNGTYQNPILHADYSDPDVIRVGNDFYLVASSFETIPALPILHSKDLVNWTIIGHALNKLLPSEHFAVPQHGNGVWAPSLRYHKGEFYLYYPDPDYGIYLVKAKNAGGPWSEPILVEAGKGLIDPCPLWDKDGQAYLIHAWAGSRAGIKSILTLKKMNPSGTKVLDQGVIVYDGHEKDPTIEGPKLYQRNGYYYIFAPAGGVATGWQLVLRSKNIYGPYERKLVMDQGKSGINGPHQGAWVNTATGEDWFLHFQDKAVYGRVVHLQPMKWTNDWPLIGIDKEKNGEKGEPVLVFQKPAVGKTWPIQTPADSDEFNTNELGKQWQWAANPLGTWVFMNTEKGSLRLFSEKIPDTARNLWETPNVLLQKFPAESFMVTTKMNFSPNAKLDNEKAGLVIMGFSYAGLSLKSNKDGTNLVYTVCKDAVKGKTETEKIIQRVDKNTVFFRVKVQPGGKCIFGYSTNGETFTDIEEVFQAEMGRWIGARVGLFCIRNSQTNDSGYADFDWFRVTPMY
jgi:beta-xylosidase